MEYSDEDGRESPDREGSGDASDDLKLSDDRSKDSLTVVGIGASAGGLKPLRVFFENIPARTGLAFVVVVHLSPEHESSLAELLQGSAAMPVKQVSGRVDIEADHVYVIPPNKNIQVTDHHLDLSDFDEPHGQRSPIDFFFRTLAEKHPDGVAILFSGGGTDGTVGMKAVKESGGLLMAQMPEEAEHDQMPRSAIATGLVDFVLPAQDLAEKLVEIRRKGIAPMYREAPAKLPESDEKALRKMLTQIHSRTGHDFTGYKQSTMLRRVARRMRVTSAVNLESYLQYLRANATEAEALLTDFLISVTNFFRDADAFEALTERVVPLLLEGKSPHDEVRVWVAGCATGEEAYSVAMLLLEAKERMEVRTGIQIFATDLDDDALAYGREGIYPDAIGTDVSEERLKRFFLREGAYYRVGKELRDSVLFAAHNLLRDPPFANLDLVSCRNLRIYLQRELQEKLCELFHYALRPDGYLFLGSSESMGGRNDLFRAVDKRHRIYIRKAVPGRAMHLPELPLRHVRPRPLSRVSHREVAHRGGPAATDYDMHRSALEANAPPSILVDSDHTVVHLSDTAGRYLRHPGGSATLSIVKVARDEIRVDLREALRQTLERNEATISRPIEMEIEGERRFVQLYVRPVPQEDVPPFALVIFGEGMPLSSWQEPTAPSSDEVDERVRRMQEEVERVNVRLKTTIEESETQHEELKSTNEELQSTNEEYKSTLEELETSKEELQSVNEELKTVNDELKDKVEALSRANSDLKNFMAATEVATLFLDRDLRIRRFTQALTKIFNIMPMDEGRPLSHVTHRLQCDTLERDALHVLESLVPTQSEVRDEEGRRYLLRIGPYRTTEDRIRGVVLTFVDVTRMKVAEEELHRAQERYALLIRSVKEYAIFMIDMDGHITSWNAGATHLFGYTEDEALGKAFGMIFVDEDLERGAAQGEIETAKREGQALDERWYKRKDGEQFWGSGILAALHDEHGALHGFAKVLRDNTRRREAAQALEQSQQRLKRLNEELEERVVERTSELQQAHDRVRELASELVKAEQRERHRIAQLLHDDLQQRLYGIQMKTSFIRRDVEGGNSEQVLEHVAAVEKWLDETIARTRELSIDLSPPILHNEGLKEAVLWLAAQMEDRHGLDVEVMAAKSFSMKDEGLRTLLFQLIRELLFNVVKHAGSAHAVVELERADGEIRISVHDEGSGFNVEDAVQENESESSFGLFNVRERLNFIGGRLEIESAPGKGSNVLVSVPAETA